MMMGATSAPAAASVSLATMSSATTQISAHITVLLNEAVNALNIKPSGTYIDGTFGRGGHSRLILSKLDKAGCEAAILEGHCILCQEKHRYELCPLLKSTGPSAVLAKQLLKEYHSIRKIENPK